MKRVMIGIIFFISLMVLQNDCFAAEGDDQAGRLVNDFVQNAMAELKIINSSDLDYAEIGPGIKEYAAQMSKSLFESGLSEETVNVIMQKTAAWYGQAVAQIFSGNNYADAIDSYAGKITDLFSQEHLDIAAQSPVLSLSSRSLESMYGLLKDLDSDY